MLTGNVPLALNYSDKSVAIFTALDNQMGIAYGYINMGLVYRNEKNYVLALKYLEQAKSIREKIGDKKGMASVNLELARVYQLQGQLDKALTSYVESYNRHLAINNLRYAAWCLNGMGEVYYLKKDYQNAQDAFLKAITLNQARNHQYGEIDNQLGLALVHAQLGNREDGEKALHRAVNISTGMGLHTSVLETYETMARFYQILNDYRQATENFDRFLLLYDSLLSIQQYDILNEVQNNFDMSQRLSQTKQQLSLREKETKYLVIILILMVSIIAIVFWKLRSRKETNLKLQSINQTKDKLFSVISHDLKSPFNTLMGFTELLIEELENNRTEHALEYAGYIKQSAEDNLNLLNNLLKWSQAQSGRIAFKPEPVMITQLFDELEEFFKLEANKRKIVLSFTSSLEHEIQADPSILRIIILNLISNALKYTPELGTIKVAAYHAKNIVVIVVKDNGVGMPVDMVAKMFDNSTIIESKEGLRNEKGTGLGLMLSADLVKIHQGKINVWSEEGIGSIFEIEFPDSY
jgi:signal transduction histidine kinase